ncbi:MAG: ATP-binding protein [Phycisphaerae bacterium]
MSQCGANLRAASHAARRGLLAVTLLWTALASASASSVHPPKRVVVLNSFSRDQAYSSHQEAAIRAALVHDYPGTVVMQFEYLDRICRSDEDYARRVAEFLIYKYQHHSADLLVTTDSAAYEFVSVNDTTFLPGVPMVFCAVPIEMPPLPFPSRKVTGVHEWIDYDANLRLIFELHRSTRQVLFIGDSTAYTALMYARIEAAFGPYSDRATLTPLQTDNHAEILGAVRGAPADSVILYGHAHFIDTSERQGHDSELRRLCADAPVPMYVLLDTHFGEGAVGGKVTSGQLLGRAAGELAVRVLLGVDPATIPIARDQGTAYVFDHRALERFGIAESSLPPASDVRSKPPSLIAIYRWPIVIGCLVIATIQAAVIVQLLVQRRRRLRATQALAESEERYRRLIDTCPDAIVVYREDKIVFANREAAVLHGVERAEDYIGRSIWEFLHPDDHDVTSRRIGEILRTDVHSPLIEIRIRRTDGTFRIVESTGITCTFGGQRCIQAVLRDITTRRELEQQRRQLENRIVESQKLESLGLLAGGIAHDFNNLLTSVLGHASLARSTVPEGTNLDAALQKIEIAADRAADLCRQLLAYSGKGAVALGPVRLVSLIREMADLLRLSISKRVRLILDLHEDTPCVVGDATQLRQIVMNLITNASEAIGDRDGTITIRCGQRECAADDFRGAPAAQDVPPAGRYAFVEVQDTGCGIAPAALPRLFEPFFTTKFTGRGLGLSAVLGIARSHGGVLLVETAEGRGTTFRVFLPSGAAVAHVAPPPSNNRSPAARGSGTILVVDDEPLIREFARKTLISAGYAVLQAADGDEALRTFQARSAEIDGVLLDVSMPGKSGLDILPELTALRPGLLVVLSTGYSQQSLPRSTAGSLATAVLPKPYRAADLIGQFTRRLPATAS